MENVLFKLNLLENFQIMLLKALYLMFFYKQSISNILACKLSKITNKFSFTSLRGFVYKFEISSNISFTFIFLEPRSSSWDSIRTRAIRIAISVGAQKTQLGYRRCRSPTFRFQWRDLRQRGGVYGMGTPDGDSGTSIHWGFLVSFWVGFSYWNPAIWALSYCIAFCHWSRAECKAACGERYGRGNSERRRWII